MELETYTYDYKTAQRECGIKLGDVVEVIPVYQDSSRECTPDSIWYNFIIAHIGCKGRVIEINDMSGMHIKLTNNDIIRVPYFSLKKTPTYITMAINYDGCDMTIAYYLKHNIKIKCRCWDNDKNYYDDVYVIGYINDNKYKYITNVKDGYMNVKDGYINATPLTTTKMVVKRWQAVKWLEENYYEYNRELRCWYRAGHEIQDSLLDLCDKELPTGNTKVLNDWIYEVLSIA